MVMVDWTHRSIAICATPEMAAWRNPTRNGRSITKTTTPCPGIVVPIVARIGWTIYIVVVAIAEGRDGCRHSRSGVYRCNWCSSNHRLCDYRSRDNSRCSDSSRNCNNRCTWGCQSSSQTKRQTAENVPCHPVVPAMMSKCRHSDKHRDNHNHLLHFIDLFFLCSFSIYLQFARGNPDLM